MGKTVPDFVELRHIEKTFPGVKALDDVSFAVRQGEVHALCGENGAGKSTLIKILTGVYRKDAGATLVGGREVEIRSPYQAIEMGISCIYQELSVVPTLDVAKNLFLGNLPMGRLHFVDRKRMYAEAQQILRRIGLNISPKTRVSALSISRRQMVEIGRALTRNARLIIMDEPTSSLSEREVKTLFALIRKLKADGVSIIYISHKINEIMEISDRITVLRDGKVITTLETRETASEQLISHMVGRTLDNLYSKMKVRQAGEAIRVEGLSKKGAFEGISFTVRHGEVVGFFGLVGASRTKIAEAIFGIGSYDNGQIFIDGEQLHIRSSRDAIENGISLVPEDRQRCGIAATLSVLSNMTLAKLRDISTLGVINGSECVELTDQYINNIHIKAASIRQPVENLSGGNQQKVVISKWLMLCPKVLILDEPTRGIDVAARAEVYALISELASQGMAVIVISSDIPEILGTCDRVITVFKGRITRTMNVRGITRDVIISAAMGED